MSDKFKEWFPFIMFFPLFLVLAGLLIGIYQKRFLEECNSGMYGLATIHVVVGILAALIATLLLIETLKRMSR